MDDMIEFLGLCAAFCTSFSFFAQVLNIWKTKSTKDISFLMYIILSCGLVLWIVYGVLINSVAVILSNSVTLIFSISIIGMKVQYEK